MSKFFVIVIMISLNFVSLAQNNLWLKKLEQIKPLESKEKDLKRLLGKPQNRFENIGEYKIKEGLVSVIFSKGKCTNHSFTEFNVEKGTVISFDFTPKKNIKFSSLKLNLTEFDIRETSDVSDGLEYTDKEKGISFAVLNDVLKYVSFSGRSDILILPCSEIKK